MIRIAVLILFSLWLCSCGTTHFIVIQPDRSAYIKSDAYISDSMRLSKSNIISDLKSKDGLYSFKISNIDSLGQNMGDIISSNYFTFRYYPDSLVISSNSNLPVTKTWDSWECCGYAIEITIDKEIEKVKTQGKKLKVRRKKNEKKLTVIWDVNHRKNINNRAKKLSIVFKK